MFLLRCLRWDLFGSLFGTRTFAPKYPLQRNICDAKLFRLRNDLPRHVRRKLLSMRPFLYGSLSYGATQRSGELPVAQGDPIPGAEDVEEHRQPVRDRKSTRLNSSHSQISYAVFCLKKKKKHIENR